MGNWIKDDIKEYFESGELSERLYTETNTMLRHSIYKLNINIFFSDSCDDVISASWYRILKSTFKSYLTKDVKWSTVVYHTAKNVLWREYDNMRGIIRVPEYAKLIQWSYVKLVLQEMSMTREEFIKYATTGAVTSKTISTKTVKLILDVLDLMPITGVIVNHKSGDHLEILGVCPSEDCIETDILYREAITGIEKYLTKKKDSVTKRYIIKKRIIPMILKNEVASAKEVADALNISTTRVGQIFYEVVDHIKNDPQIRNELMDVIGYRRIVKHEKI